SATSLATLSLHDALPILKSEPVIRPGPAARGHLSLVADDASVEPLRNLPFAYRLGPRHLYVEPGAELLFTANETSAPRVYGPWARSRKPYVKDAFHRFVVAGDPPAVNPQRRATPAGRRPRTVPSSATTTGGT